MSARKKRVYSVSLNEYGINFILPKKTYKELIDFDLSKSQDAQNF